MKKKDPAIVLEVLLDVFSEDHGSDNYSFQEIAGGLLWKLRPIYKRNIYDDLKEVLKNWNLSVEELPWYFADQIGIEALKDIVLTFLEEETRLKKKSLETILFWISKDPEIFKEQLNHKWLKIKG